jgi:hypothetical protein
MKEWIIEVRRQQIVSVLDAATIRVTADTEAAAREQGERLLEHEDELELDWAMIDNTIQDTDYAEIVRVEPEPVKEEQQ